MITKLNKREVDGGFIYVTGVRYHRPDYPYRLAVEERGSELIIYHQSKDKEKWMITCGIGIKKDDLIKILNTIK